MIKSVISSQEKKENSTPQGQIDDSLMFINPSHHTLTYYFKHTQITRRSRYSNFVLMPILPTLIPASTTDSSYVSSSNAPILDYDSDELIEFSATTISKLKNVKKLRVYPLPLIMSHIESLEKNSMEYRTFKPYSLANCVTAILTEKQFTPTFNIVGHGTPTGIGTSDTKAQISPTGFANKMHQLFERYGLSDELKKHPISFEFHTCNSAYANIHPESSRADVYACVRENSFIGKFYNALKRLGYQSISVTGYRGYYIDGVSTKEQVQDSFHSPTLLLNAIEGKYTISENGTIKSIANDSNLAFHVECVAHLLPKLGTPIEETSVEDWMNPLSHKPV